MIKIRRSWIFSFIIYFMMFQQALIYAFEGNIFSSIISYVDDLVGAIALTYVIYYVITKRFIYKDEKSILYIVVVFNLVGILSTFIYSVNSAFPAFVDFLTCNKFIAVFLATLLYSRKNTFILDTVEYMNSCVRGIVLIIGFLDFINVFVYQIFPTHGFRVFMDSQQLFYNHPNDLAGCMLLCIFILLINSKEKHNDVYFIICSLVVVSTMRIRMVAFLALFWAVYLYFIKLKLKSKWLLYVAAGAVVLLVGYDQIAYYYGTSAETRSIVTVTAVTLANKYFPIGLGFASYATNMAREYYSPIYTSLGFENIWGLNATNDTFLTDQFWPAILGQFGWIGMILFVFLLIYIYKMIAKVQSKDIILFCSALLVFAYEILTSLGETAYFNPLAIVFFFYLAICIEKARIIK